MSHLSQVLVAGGLVPTSAKLGKDDVVDTVVARGYRHPVLPGRTVVRLTAEAVAAGDDLEMSVLGFGAGEDRGAVGKQRKRPLGFPGWALVHDPKNARYALDVVGELKKHKRKAKSKPGHAKEGIDKLAARLGKTVPHFLPSFFEEAGRAFIEHGAASFAATMFAKAREAEAVHALEVDELHRVDAFLEFALAGAVTTKALTEYAKQLGEHHEPAVAYAHFRQLCVQRTLGGMPPWSGMAKDLRRLAKAAKLDADAEDARLVEEIVESPALTKAAGEFWRAYADAIVALAKRSALVRGRLLDLFPTGGGDDLDATWLDLVDQSGAVDALVGDAPAEARPDGGRAKWFDKLCAHLARSWRKGRITERAFALLRRMAPALVADGKPIACVARWHRIDLDLAELALELGIAVEPTEHTQVDLSAWAEHAGEPDHGRDPVRCAAHAKLGPLLADSVAEAMGEDAFDAASRGKAGFLAAKRRWLEGLLARAEAQALPALADVLDEVTAKVKPETFAELPDLHARFAAIDVAPLLARTLRVGIYDEHGWPALEDAIAELAPDGKVELTLHGALPALIVANATRAIAVAPRGRLGAHDFVVPAKTEVASARFIGGQFLVALKASWKVQCYWSSAPNDVFETEGNAWRVNTLVNRACVLADGAWAEGGRAIRVGDRAWPESKIVASDGTTSWMLDWKDGKHVMKEVSAAGEPGRTSWPAFIETAVAEGWQIEGDASYVLPAPGGVTASPLGAKDGFIGVRARHQGESRDAWTAREVIRADGRSYAGPVDARVRELLTLPGGELRPVTEHTAWRSGTTGQILDDTGAFAGSDIEAGKPRYWRGSTVALSPALWHALVPRDAAGSQRLRTATAADARALIDALAGKSVEQLGELVPVEVVTAKLPEITNPRLQRGVAGIVALAAQLQAQRDALRAERAPGMAGKSTAAAGPGDDAIKEALGGWLDTAYGRGSTASEIARIGAWFRSDDRTDRSDGTDTMSSIGWQPLAVAPGMLAFLAGAVGLSAEHRKTIEALHAALAGELPDSAKLSCWTGVKTVAATKDDDDDKLVVRWHGGNAYAIFHQGWSNTNMRVLEYAPDGVWKPLPLFSVTARTVGAGAVALPPQPTLAIGDAERLAELTGMTRSEAAYLLAGCPDQRSRDNNFLDKALREMLGVKATQAAVARDSLRVIPLDKRIAAVDAAARAGGTVDALAAAWIAHVGKRVAIPEELIADADRELHAPTGPAAALAMIGSADDAPELTRDTCWGLDADGDVIAVAAAAPLVGQDQLGDPSGFDDDALTTACTYLPFLYAELPVGHPLRARAVRAHELVLARLAAPTLLLNVGRINEDEDDRHDKTASVDALFASLGGDTVTGLGEGHSARRIPGAVITRYEFTYGKPVKTAVRLGVVLHPATLDARAIDTVGKLAQMVSYDTTWPMVQYARGDDLAAMMKRIAKTPVANGGWEQNPLAGVPELVGKVARKLKLSSEAAALYLQYLVLLWPTPKNLQLWNGWKPKQLEIAQAELVKEDLVLEAKRERAQRGHFLPGGWEALRSPHPPMETWKAAFYGKRGTDGQLHAHPIRSMLALAPFHLLFERAWQRIERGDVPKYDEVKR